MEDAALEYLRELGYDVSHGPEYGPEGDTSERSSYKDVILKERFRQAIHRLNPALPSSALQDAFNSVIRSESPALTEENRRLHRLLVDGVDVEYQNEEGRTVGAKAWLVDWDEPATNDWLALNQVTVEKQGQDVGYRRADVVVYLNGLPVAILELKSLQDEDATIEKAYEQLQTYKQETPDLFRTNEVLVISDGTNARLGSLTAGWEWFLPWRTVDGEEIAPKGSAELSTLLQGVFRKDRFLDLIRNFTVYWNTGEQGNKLLSAYHQFHAVQKGVACTLEAAAQEGDGRAGVVWHTQGSGKSLTMSFYAGKIIQQPEMENPTLVLLTDRNDLDGQLFDTFSKGRDLLRQDPIQAESRDHLQELLTRASGGVIFTTIQKFFPEDGGTYPELSDRHNIIVIADEAHRSQYGFIDGFARHMHDALPNATFIGFTGTPIEKEDKSTPAIFGDYIDVYDIERAVEDGATVPIYYENRLAKIYLDEQEKEEIDDAFEDLTEGKDLEFKERLKSRWSSIEALVGAERRLRLVAEDIVDHFETRLETLEGKGMIVGMSRSICVDLYDYITDVRPEWHDPDDDKGKIKLVMTGSASDPADWQQHIRSKEKRRRIQDRVKDPDDPLKLVIVCDMWLTGFDAPPLHTMYLDKPMNGHTLMQAIARVNRVFRDKPGGLVVDYIGVADDLKNALQSYTEGDREYAGVPQEAAVNVMLEKHEVVSAMLHNFDYSGIHSESATTRMELVPAAAEHILSQDDPEAKDRFNDAVKALSKAYSLAATDDRAREIRDEVAFFQAVRNQLREPTGPSRGPSTRQLDTAVRQIVSDAVAPEGVVDIFETAGLERPDISILSDDFLDEVKDLPHRNLAVELLEKLIEDEIETRSRNNIVQARSFKELLEKSVQRYRNRSVKAAQVIEELIDIAKDLREAQGRGEELGLSEAEVAFYDALAENESAEEVMGEEALKALAQKLVEEVQSSVTVDWTKRRTARAKIKVTVKRLLREYGYPPDMQREATELVLSQAEVLADEWARA